MSETTYEVLSSEHFLVLLHHDKSHSLIFNRLDGSISSLKYEDAKELSNLRRIGKTYGVIGTYLNKFLVLIRSRCLVGSLYDPKTKRDHQIYVIQQVQVIDISCLTPSLKSNVDRKEDTKRSEGGEDAKYNKPSQRRQVSVDDSDMDYSSLPISISTNNYRSGNSWNPFKIAANSLKPRVSSQFIKTLTSETDPVSRHASGSEAIAEPTSPPSDLNYEESERRLVEEMIKLFANTNSFYYSPSLDLTRRLSTGSTKSASGCIDSREPMWKTAKTQYFWNRHMLSTLTSRSESDEDINLFILVILHGFISIEEIVKHTPTRANTTTRDTPFNAQDCDIDVAEEAILQQISPVDVSNIDFFQLAIISRRSVYHAGTRYLRRGCNEDGHCANFVETEQILRCNQHFNSLILLRGSIPLFWYQAGFNYRPPPILVRSEQENHAVFKKHFKDLLETYEANSVIAVDCTEHSGREAGLHNAYKKHFDQLRAELPALTLIEFDFHKHCKGRQCSDSQVDRHLKACGLDDQLVKDMRYYWNDSDNILTQESIIRVNCIDCSDRTNVVQRVIALRVLDMQLARLGAILPYTSPENNEFRKLMSNMWSANGNALSTQYCGTRALFTGDKKIAGYLKDTYSSASRYYIGKFRDAYRQAAINAMLGVEDIDKDNLGIQRDLDHLNLDSILSGQRGGALLKDVSSKVSDRLARLKYRFNVLPFTSEQGEYSMANETGVVTLDGLNEPDVADDRARALGEMNIDWPSSDSIDNGNPRNTEAEVRLNENGSVQYTSSDDFHDDKYGHLMLSPDLSKFQEFHEPRESARGSVAAAQIESIGMTEAGSCITPAVKVRNQSDQQTVKKVRDMHTDEGV